MAVNRKNCMQYFYLISQRYDESTSALKTFLNLEEAIQYGREKATELQPYGNYEVILERQPISKKGQYEYVETLEPFSQRGSDFDIDLVRADTPENLFKNLDYIK